MATASARLGAERAQRASHGSPEWYTPDWLMRRITAFLGDGWYDPCPARQSKPLTTNGLSESWRGRAVYCNPPYGRDIPPWIIKAMTEPLREIILLVPASTDTQWFAPLFAHTLLFITGRVYFSRPKGEALRAPATPHPSVLVYRGRRYRQFADAFSDLGPVLR
ncbi:MAG: DNA N-6-adenine-methyltransferase, partial [Chloroflexota bacterium]